MKILVPIDGSENSLAAVKHAAGLAKLYDDTELTLSYVIVYEPFYMDSKEVIEEAGNKKAEAAFKEAIAACGDVKYDTVIERGGSAADKIVDIAEKGGYDMIIMGSVGASSLKRFLMGSVTSRVAQYAPCTVVLVR